MSSGPLTAFQVEVGRLFFSLPEAEGFLLAGGAALAASGLTDRPTHDLDMFSHAPTTSVTAVRDAFVEAVRIRGWSTTTVRATDTFCRLVVHGEEDLLVDLAIDSPPSTTPVVTMLGPTFAPVELAGRKLLALFDRAEARDFADVFALTQRFDRETLLSQAVSIDPGFDLGVLAQMIQTLGRFSDDEIPAPADLVPTIRAYFVEWSAALRATD